MPQNCAVGVARFAVETEIRFPRRIRGRRGSAVNAGLTVLDVTIEIAWRPGLVPGGRVCHGRKAGAGRHWGD